jgi:hypothetical protein
MMTGLVAALAMMALPQETPTDAQIKAQRERLDLMLAAQAAAKESAAAAAKLAAFDEAKGRTEAAVVTDRTPAEAATVVTPSDAPKTAAEAKTDSAARRKFGELDLGVGLSFTLDRGDRDRVADAILDENRIVRVTDQNNVRARIMLEAHYFFTPCGSFLGHFNACVPTAVLKASNLDGDVSDDVLIADIAAEEKEKENRKRVRRSAVPKRALWGIGPFVAIEGGGDSIINAIGAGLMIGFRKSAESTQSFNFGFGYVVDPNTRVLGDNVRENQPLPTGETQVRFKETAQGGLLFLTSFSF